MNAETETISTVLTTELIETSKDLNGVFATANVNYTFRTHYVDTASQTYGIEQLICSILCEHNAAFPSGSESSSLRSVVIAGSMFFAEIENEVRRQFGEDRYPAATLRNYLRGRAKKVGKVKLICDEDPSGRKPRTKYFIAE